jgi:cytochrome b pre-mRNA-processing protein 3
MDDTFHSWFIVRGLHVWMLMARLMNEGEKGRLLRNAVVEAMWEDVEAKSKRLGVRNLKCAHIEYAFTFFFK